MPKKVKYIPCRLLLYILNEESIHLEYNQNIRPEAFAKIPETAYPITQSIDHHYPHREAVRCNVVLNDKGDVVLLDIPMDRYNDLPETEVPDG